MSTSRSSQIATAADLMAVLQMSVGWALTAVLPQKAIPVVARTLARFTLAVSPGAFKQGVDKMNRRFRLVGTGMELRDLFAEHYMRRYEHLMGRILDTHARGWHPEIELTGIEHVHKARLRGKGTILWGMSFCGPIIAKAALFRAGIPVIHLSTPYHGGFSKSLLAIGIINPWNLKSENKYLTERIVIPLDNSLDYLRLLKERLLNNGCISIIGEHTGRQNIEVPFLSGKEQFATGAANLARSTCASLLTVYSFRLGPGRYRVVVEPPIEIPREAGRSEVLWAAVQEFARRLEAHIREHPEDWEKWSVPIIV
jgi:lauroyl/myristoyl acyltransferase